MNARHFVELAGAFALIAFLTAPLMWMPLILTWIAGIFGVLGLASMLIGKWDYALIGIGIGLGIALGLYVLYPYLWSFILHPAAL